MKNILIPTDFSENSRNAIKYAQEYFSDIPVNFYLLHVSPNKPSEIREPAQPFESESQQVIDSPVTQLLEEIKICKSLTLNPLHIFFSIYENISLVESIRKQLVEKEIDYILMGTRGASNIARTDIGSNTSEVITKVKCPVLVIPPQAKFKGVKNIAFPTNYNCIYKNRVVSTLFETLKLQNAALRILHIKSSGQNLNQEQVDNKNFIQDFLKETKHSFHILENNNIEMGIQDFVETWEIDMIAIVAKNLNIIQRLLFNPMDKTVSYHNEIPFLVMHE